MSSISINLSFNSWYLVSTDFSRLWKRASIDFSRVLKWELMVAVNRSNFSRTWVMTLCDGTGSWHDSSSCSFSYESLAACYAPEQIWGKFFLFKAYCLKWKHFLIVGSLSSVVDANISARVRTFEFSCSSDMDAILVVNGWKTWKCRANPITIFPIEIDALGALATCHSVWKTKYMVENLVEVWIFTL